MEEQLTETFGKFIVETRYEDLPDEVIQQAKRCILDFFGVALAGSRLGLAPLITDLVCDSGGKEEATLIGDPRRIPVLNAALLNGVRGHTLDMDDGHRYANAHPAAAIIPAAIALAERQDAANKELIESIVVGYEIFIRIARAMNPAHLKKGFHTTGTVGPFGAAAACSKLLRLSAKKVQNALGIAGLQGAGLLEVMDSGQMMKPLHPGRAAQSGVLAAFMAELGAEGPEEILEGPKGYFRAFSDGVDVTRLVGGLGATFEIPNVYFKMHAACRHVHPVLDALREIVNAHGVSVEEIERIDASTYSVAYSLVGRNKEATSDLAAKFSIPVSVALMLLYGRAGTDEYSMECVGNPAVQGIADRVFVTVDELRDKCYPAKRGAEVKVKTRRGTFRSEIEIPRGDPENPFTYAELRDKFLSNATKVLPRNVAMDLERLVMGEVSNPVREIMGLVRTSQPKTG